MKRLFLFCVLFGVGVLTPGCGCRVDKNEVAKGRKAARVAASANLDKELKVAGDKPSKGLVVSLSQAEAAMGKWAETPVSLGEFLSEEETEKLLSSAKPLAAEKKDKLEFAVRKGSLPPPRTGEIVELVFPPSAVKKIPESGEEGILEVVRYAPKGEVSIAPHLSITFSKPMVPVGRRPEDVKKVPVTLSPLPPGKWQWLGTKTLMFKPVGRFPMATDYRVSVDKAASVDGEDLKQPLSFSFSTPPPKVVNQYPQKGFGPQDLLPVVFLEFDQKINPVAMAEKIELSSKRRSYKLVKATDAQIAADENAEQLKKNAVAGHWLALVPESPLPKGRKFELTVKKGAPSAEGEKKTLQNESFSFFTYEPLKIVATKCGYENKCPPDREMSITFNNPLDPEHFSAEFFKVSPDVIGLQVNQHNEYVGIGGLKQGRTRYIVAVDKRLKDKFGQTLGKTVEVAFNVGPAKETLFRPAKKLITLDPAGHQQFSFSSINHKSLKVKVHQVSPKDWAAWVDWNQKNRYETAKPAVPPGKLVLDDVINVADAADKIVSTTVNLAPYLDQGLGHLILQVSQMKKAKNRWNRQDFSVWIQSTTLGASAFVDAAEMVVWATDLQTGAPAEGCEAKLWPAGTARTADSDGLIRLELSAESEDKYLTVSKGKDTVLIPGTGYSYYGGGWKKIDQRDYARWFVFDDRGIYKPGETVHIKGFARNVDQFVNGDVSQLKSKDKKITWEMVGPRRNKIASGEAVLSKLSGFDITLKLPDDVNLGRARLNLSLEKAKDGLGKTHTHFVSIQEFRKPEFEVNATLPSGPYVIGQSVVVDLKATYFAQGGLADAPVFWNTWSKSARYTPPNRSDYAFGRWSPWWFWMSDEQPSNYKSLKGKTDAGGNHHLGVSFDSANPPTPSTLYVEGTVEDVNRQQWSTKKTLLVHPGAFYVGLRTGKAFYGRNEQISVNTIVTDIDGKLQQGIGSQVTFAKMKWVEKQGRWQEEAVDPQSCNTVSKETPSECVFAPKVGGKYRIQALVKDAKARLSLSEMYVWVAGGETPPSRSVEKEKVTLIPEQEIYQPGQTATFMIQAPFYPAQGVLSIRRSGMVSERPFVMDGPTKTMSIDIVEAHIPNVHVQVDLVGQSPREDASSDYPNPEKGSEAKHKAVPKRVAYASGKLTFKVPPLVRTLAVTASPQDTKLTPGGKTTLDVQVTDHQNAPVKNAEMAVVVVDEAVLSLSDYKTPDPVSVFYAARAANVRDYHSRNQVLLASQDELLASQSGRRPPSEVMVQRPLATPLGGHAEGGMGMRAEAVAEMAVMDDDDGGTFRKAKGSFSAQGSKEQNIKTAVRTNFDAVALFAPKVVTNAEGKATVQLRLPDSLTRYRVMVVAVAGDNQFGKGESSVTAQLPLMVRPSAPRFLNFGDKFELPVVLQNQTDNPMSVSVAVAAANLSLGQSLDDVKAGPAEQRAMQLGQKVTVPAQNRIEVRFPAASQMAGTARFQVVARSASGAADAARIALPVWTPATSEAFATYGQVEADGIVAHSVVMPDDVWTEFGGLDITTSATQLQALTDAVLYITAYPYDCNEQIASRVLSIVALKDVLQAFEADGLPSAEVLRKSVDQDLKKLFSRQNGDGGFAFWRRGDASWPYLTIHVAHAAALAKQAGYQVPESLWRRVTRYLKRIERHIPGWYSKESKLTIRAYALYVLHKMGNTEKDQVKDLMKKAPVKEFPMEALGLILPVLKAADQRDAFNKVQRHVLNNVAETAAGAHFVTSYKDGAHVLLHSSRRVDGILLAALIEVDPKSDLIPKLVHGLLAHRQAGKWANTQETSFVLVAMERYFNKYEKVKPSFVVRAWLGDDYLLEHGFKDRTTQRKKTAIDMEFISKGKQEKTLVIDKKGKGRMYYRLGMTYAPKELDLPPVDNGFVVVRTYEAVDNEGDVHQDKEGVWHIRAGAKVRVKLNMAATMRRYHVALVDPIAAGMEPLNPALATSQTVLENEKQDKGYWWWHRPWFEHQNMRDERVEAFTSLLWDGVHEYSYVAKATTPGEFVVPPAKAEEMYQPEVFGRSATDRILIE